MAEEKKKKEDVKPPENKNDAPPEKEDVKPPDSTPDPKEKKGGDPVSEEKTGNFKWIKVSSIVTGKEKEEIFAHNLERAGVICKAVITNEGKTETHYFSVPDVSPVLDKTTKTRYLRRSAY